MLRPISFAIAAFLVTFGAVSCGDDGAGRPDACNFLPGDLVVTEIYAQPEGGDDEKEWFEVYNASGRELDLRGLRIFFQYKEGGASEKRHTIDGATPVTLPVGGYGVIGNALTGADSLWAYQKLLTNIPADGVRIRLQCDDGTVIDEVSFGLPRGDENFEFPEARSWSYQSSVAPDYLSNDEPERWQPTRSTRGAQNPPPCLCPQPPDGVTPVAPGPGSVRITELMPNPAGEDKGSEWIELAVLANGWVDLTNLRVTTNTDEPKSGLILTRATGCVLVQGGDHVIIAGDYAINGRPPEATETPTDGATDEPADATPPAEPSADEPTPDDGCPRLAGVFVHQVSDKVSLGNASSGPAGLALWSEDGDLIDEVEYTKAEVVENAAVQFVEDEAGDVVACTAARPYDTVWSTPWTLYGTPGTANPPCDACFCSGEQGELVEGRSPAPGELVITEVMPDVLGSETDFGAREWFEVFVSEDATDGRDLACLLIRYPIDGTEKPLENPDRACFHVDAGDYAIFARSANADDNGGLPRVDAVFPKIGSGLKGDNGSVGLYLPDGTVLDEVDDWGPSDDGVAVQFDGDRLEDDPVSENDGPDGWCSSFAGFGDVAGQFGTPGAPNFSCTSCYCFDGDEWMKAPAPTAGEIRITEFLGNPHGTDTGREWIEVRSDAPATRYLDCLQVRTGDDVSDVLRDDNEGCHPIQPGAYAVLCDDPAEAALVGIQGCIRHDAAAIKQSDSSVGILYRGETLDEVSYAGFSEGVSLMLAPDGITWCDTPEDPANCFFGCQSEDVWYGTPGGANPNCAAAL